MHACAGLGTASAAAAITADTARVSKRGLLVMVRSRTVDPAARDKESVGSAAAHDVGSGPQDACTGCATIGAGLMSPEHAAVVARALARWPGLSACVPAAALDLAATPADAPGSAPGSAIDRGAELYLARACAAGDDAAIRAFEAEFFAEVRACHARIRPRNLGLDELEQRVREKLFVKNAIASFSGKGDLRRWLRVLTTRLIFDVVRVAHPEVPLEDQLLPDSLAAGADATLAKAQLRAEIRAALHDAFSALTD